MKIIHNNKYRNMKIMKREDFKNENNETRKYEEKKMKHEHNET